MRLLVAIGLLLSLAAVAEDVQIVPAPGRELEACRLVRTETQLILFIGEKEIKRFTHSYGRNMTDALTFHDNALLVATQTLGALRAQGACR